MAGEVARIEQRLAGIAAFDDRREIEDGEGDHRPDIGARGPRFQLARATSGSNGARDLFRRAVRAARLAA
ncbi:hypothetical protein GCM10023232_07750 [Sphingosinicella ginsenosidimutans]